MKVERLMEIVEDLQDLFKKYEIFELEEFLKVMNKFSCLFKGKEPFERSTGESSERSIEETVEEDNEEEDEYVEEGSRREWDEKLEDELEEKGKEKFLKDNPDFGSHRVAIKHSKMRERSKWIKKNSEKWFNEEAKNFLIDNGTTDFMHRYSEARDKHSAFIGEVRKYLVRKTSYNHKLEDALGRLEREAITDRLNDEQKEYLMQNDARSFKKKYGKFNASENDLERVRKHLRHRKRTEKYWKKNPESVEEDSKVMRLWMEKEAPDKKEKGKETCAYCLQKKIIQKNGLCEDCVFNTRRHDEQEKQS